MNARVLAERLFRIVWEFVVVLWAYAHKTLSLYNNCPPRVVRVSE